MQVVKALEQILADSYAFFKTQNYHWNVEGAESFII